MRVLLASPRGFCAGVNRAIESLRLAVERFERPIYVYHEIVHNRWVVEAFRRQGVVFVDQLSEVPRGAHLLYSAHGVSPVIREEATRRELITIDATCPLVRKVHSEAIRFAREGYKIVLIGHESHDEVVGTMGEAPEAIRLITRPEQVDELEIAEGSKVAYLTQTTLSVDDARTIVERLRARFPQIIGPPGQDICFATQNRQQAVVELAREADLGLVVGSQNSSNSRRLAELCRTGGIDAHLIDGPEEIDLGWFEGGETVLLTAGASAPEAIVQECVSFLVSRFQATVEPRVFREEKVRFHLPEELQNE